MRLAFNSFKFAIVAFFFLSLNACTKDSLETGIVPEEIVSERSSADVADLNYYALTRSGLRMEKYNTLAPGTAIRTKSFVGLQSNEKLLAIDFRPSNGLLYGISNQSRLYTVDTLTGTLTMVGTSALTTTVADGIASFDFNPVTGALRIVSATGQDLSINADTAEVLSEGVVAPVAVGTVWGGAAFTNNVAGATSTEMYTIDLSTQQLFKYNTVTSTFDVVGSLGLSGVMCWDGGFDIVGNTALALFRVNSRTKLYSIDLTTGAATQVHKYKEGRNFGGIAIEIVADNGGGNGGS